VNAPPASPLAAPSPDAEPAHVTLKFERESMAAARGALVDHALAQASDGIDNLLLATAREMLAAQVLGDTVKDGKVSEEAAGRVDVRLEFAAALVAASVPEARIKLAMAIRRMLREDQGGAVLPLLAGILADLTILDGATVTPPAECLHPVESDADVAFWRQKAAEAEKREREARGTSES
jgi:hypothetical protein